MTNDVEYPSMYLVPICISSLEKRLFRSFAHFLIVFLSLSCKRIWDNVNARPSSYVWLTDIFSHSPGGFSPSYNVLRCVEISNFDEVQLFSFFLLFLMLLMFDPWPNPRA